MRTKMINAMSTAARRWRESKVKQALGDESGATLIEYLLIAAAVTVAILAVVNGISEKKSRTSSPPAATQQLK